MFYSPYLYVRWSSPTKLVLVSNKLPRAVTGINEDASSGQHLSRMYLLMVPRFSRLSRFPHNSYLFAKIVIDFLDYHKKATHENIMNDFHLTRIMREFNDRSKL